MSSSLPEKDVKKLLGPYRATESFYKLANAGCDEVAVFSALSLIRLGWPHLDNREERTGLDRRKLETAVRRIRRVAREIEAINKHGFGLTLLPPFPGTTLLKLPKQLRLYAALLERPFKLPNTRYPTLSVCKFFLTKHVFDSTGRYYDEEVSALISAARRNEKCYDAVAHKEWRNAHYEDLLASLSGK